MKETFRYLGRGVFFGGFRSTFLIFLIISLWFLLHRSLIIARFVSTDLRLRDVLVLRKYSFSIHERSTVLIVPLTHHLIPQFLNLRCHVLQASPKTYPIPVALDYQTSNAFKRLRIPFIFMKPPHFEDPESGDFFHLVGTKSYKKVTKLKTYAVKAVLNVGFDVLLLDTDIVVCDDLKTVLSNVLKSKDIIDMYMQDNLGTDRSTGCEFNTGFYLARQSAYSLYEALVHESRSFTQSEQVLFNRLACGLNWSDSPGVCDLGNSSTPTCVWNNRIKIKGLPGKSFLTGRYENMRRFWNESLAVQCRRRKFVIWHANFNTGYDKIPFLKKNHAWLTDGASKVCKKLR